MLRGLIMMERGLCGNTANALEPLRFFLYAGNGDGEGGTFIIALRNRRAKYIWQEGDVILSV